MRAALLIVGILCGSLVTFAAADPARQLEFVYLPVNSIADCEGNTPGGGRTGIRSEEVRGGGVCVPVLSGERNAHIELADATSLPVGYFVFLKPTGQQLVCDGRPLDMPLAQGTTAIRVWPITSGTDVYCRGENWDATAGRMRLTFT